jgi:VWFA-related protein
MLSDARHKRTVLFLLICIGLRSSLAQEPKPPSTPAASDDIVRITTDLVQTDVMVFDKQGKFVDHLKADQFELRVDGKSQAISFFERIKAGAVNEEAQLAAARGGAGRRDGEPLGTVIPLDRGRSVFLFVDDVHMSAGSLIRVRDTLLRFIESELGQNDEAAVVSATGQPGFLQQLTTEKAVLRAAVGRIKPRTYNVRDGFSPPMSEAQAMAIDRNDASVTDFFVESLRRDTPMLTVQAAELMVEQRARNVLSQTQFYTDSMLITLENLVRGCAPLPGRKIILFFSDGFLLDLRAGNIKDRIQNLTDAAARSGVVIYSIGAQGLTTGIHDASSNAVIDPRLTSTDLSELSSTQEPLYTLASETGGRALVNTNALHEAVGKVLDETSTYYLLAWKPTGAPGGPSKYRRIEASVKGRPELTVIVRRGFFDAPRPELPPANTRKSKEKEKEKQATPSATPASPDRELYSALRSRHPRNSLPTSLSLGFLSSPGQGLVLTASVGVDREVLKKLSNDPTSAARVNLVGAIYNDNGEALSSFKQEMLVPPGTSPEGRHTALYSHTFRLAPGLYQVRIAAMEVQSKSAGSATQWVEVPKFDSRHFSMSSLFIGERPGAVADGTNAPTSAAAEGTVMLSVDRRFARDSAMRFVAYIYNAAPGVNSPPDVGLQVQIFRDDQPVFTAPLTKVRTTDIADLTRIPYAAELSLAAFPAGRYVLQVTAIDRIARASTSQRVNFKID